VKNLLLEVKRFQNIVQKEILSYPRFVICLYYRISKKRITHTGIEKKKKSGQSEVILGQYSFDFSIGPPTLYMISQNEIFLLH